MKKKEVEKIVKAIIKDQFSAGNGGEPEINGATKLMDGLGFDSCDMLKLRLTLEDNDQLFPKGITIPDTAIATWVTVDDTVNYIVDLQKGL